MRQVWRKVVKPVATLALGFAISVSFAQTAKADEYLWKMRAEAWPEDTAWTFRRIIYFQVIDGDTLPCTEADTADASAVDTNWVFQTITDTAGNVYYINKRDSIPSESEDTGWDWAIVRFVGEKGTKSELEERYIDIANRLEFHGDTTSTLWIHVDEMYFWYSYPTSPVERNIYFYAFNDTSYHEIDVLYKGNPDEYWAAVFGGPVYSLPFEAVQLSVEERSRLPEGSKLYVYPSPANSVVNMILGKESAYGNVRIYDETGRLVGDIHVSGGYGRGVRIDVSGLNSGVYRVVFEGTDTHGDRITTEAKFVVIK